MSGRARAALTVVLASLLLTLLWPLMTLLLRARHEASAGSEVLLWGPLMGSLKVSAVAVLVALVCGCLYASLLELTELPGKTIWRVLGLLPLALPPYLCALASISSFAPTGQSQQGLWGSWIYSWPVCGVILGVCRWPLVALPLAFALSRLEPEALAAARLARGPWGAWLWALRHCRPALWLGGLWVLALSLMDFTSSQLLRVEVLSELVYSRFESFRDLPGALMAIGPVLLMCFAAALWAGHLLSHWRFDGTRGRPQRLLSGRLSGAVAGLLALLLLTPGLFFPLLALARLVLESPEVETTGLWSLFERVLDRESAVTMGVALGAAAVAWGLGLLMAWGRLERRLGRAWFAGFMMLACVPGPVLGIALVLAWNGPGWRGVVYDSPLILVLGAFARFGAPALLVSLMLLNRHSREANEAADLASRSVLSLPGRVREQALPAALVHAMVIGEYSCFSLISPPGATPLSVRILNLFHFGRGGEYAVLALTMALMALLPGLLFLMIAGYGRTAEASAAD